MAKVVNLNSSILSFSIFFNKIHLLRRQYTINNFPVIVNEVQNINTTKYLSYSRVW